VSNKLKFQIDPLAGGEFCWYMAGGGAAWWHISNHMHFWHGAHDWNYFESVKDLIFPGDIEGGALEKVACKFVSKQGSIDVSLSKTDPNKFNELVETHCEKVDDIWVYKPDSIITRYRTAGDPNKKEKRDIRVGMLQLVIKKQPITKKNVDMQKPQGKGMLADLGAAISKRKTNSNN